MKSANAEVFHWNRANVHSDIAQFGRHLSRMQALVRSGRFRELAAETREGMRRMLAVLYRRLSELQRRAVACLAGLLLALGLAVSPLGAETITFEKQTGAANPFQAEFGVRLGEHRAAVCFADVDRDGDEDALVAVCSLVAEKHERAVLLYRKANGVLTYHSQILDPDAALSRGLEYPSIAAVDLDGDGDLDLALAEQYARLGYIEDSRGVLFCRNDSGTYTPVTGTANPFYGSLFFMEVGGYTAAFGDIDGDGDADLLLSADIDGADGCALFRNTGSATAPAFTFDSASPLGAETTFNHSPEPALVDIDNDGDLDAFVGEGETYFRYSTLYGETRIRFFENTGTPSSPSFTERLGEANPLAGYEPSLFDAEATLYASMYTTPAFTDYDEDGDLDVFVGSYYGSGDGSTLTCQGRIELYKNTTPVEVTAATQSATNVSGQTVLVQSNKFAGSVYIVLDGQAQSTVAELEAAVTARKAARAAVTAAHTPAAISTVGLAGGTYHARAASGGTSPEISPAGAKAITITAIAVEYANAAGLDSSSAWIQKVTIGSLGNETGNDSGYGDFTASAATLRRGTNVDIQLVPGFKQGSRYYIRRQGQQVWKVWVDWNQDGDFADAGEEAYSGGPSARAVSATVTVPADAPAGSTRIRVGMRYYGSGAPVAEETFDYGEVEDYTGTVE